MESDLTFPQVIDGLSAPIATTAADGRVELANRHFLAYLGMSLEELENWETSGVVHPDDLPRVLAVWRQSLQAGEPFEMEPRVRRADGTYQWVQVRGLPLRDTGNRIVRWCVLLTDIADRKRAEALLGGEKRLLEMVASGCPLEDVLEAMCRLVDTVVGESVCSILLIDRTGRFRYGVGPMLPVGYDGVLRRGTECTIGLRTENPHSLAHSCSLDALPHRVDVPCSVAVRDDPRVRHRRSQPSAAFLGIARVHP